MHNFASSPSSTGAIPPQLQRLGLWAGVVGPILYILVFTFDGVLRPGYSAFRDAVSFLLLGSSGWIEVANYIMVGLFLIFFALSFLQWRSSILPPIWQRVSTALIVLAGIGFVMAALFVPDPSGTSQHSIHAILHNVAFVIVFLPLGLTSLLIGIMFSKNAGWRIQGWYSIIAGLFSTIAALGSLIPSTSPTPSWGGIFERTLIVMIFASLVILAGRLLIQESGRAKSGIQKI